MPARNPWWSNEPARTLRKASGRWRGPLAFVIVGRVARGSECLWSLLQPGMPGSFGGYPSPRRTTMHSHFRTAAFVLSLMFILPGGLPTPRSIAAASPQSAAADPSLAALKFRAEAGDTVAQYDLALQYLCSNPTAPDYHSVVEWLSVSAAHGNVAAEFLLGYLYEHGEGTGR